MSILLRTEHGKFMNYVEIAQTMDLQIYKVHVEL